jgi:hypothetical protein
MTCKIHRLPVRKQPINNAGNLPFTRRLIEENIIRLQAQWHGAQSGKPDYFRETHHDQMELLVSLVDALNLDRWGVK